MLERQSRLDRAGPGRACSEGLRRDDLFTVVLEQFMTDTAAHADVVLPATTQLEHLDVVFSWGHHYFTLNEPAIEPRGRGQAEHRGVPADRRADGPRRSVLLARPTRSCSARCSTGAPAASTWTRCARAASRRSTSGQGPAPHAEGGFGTADGKLALETPAGRGRDRPLPHYDPPAEVADPSWPSASRWR